MESRMFSGAFPVGPRHFSCGATDSRGVLVRIGPASASNSLHVSWGQA